MGSDCVKFGTGSMGTWAFPEKEQFVNLLCNAGSSFQLGPYLIFQGFSAK